MADDSTPFTRAEAKEVLGPMLMVALKAATVASAAGVHDDDDRKKVWDDFSAAAKSLIDTLRRLDLLGENETADEHR